MTAAEHAVASPCDASWRHLPARGTKPPHVLATDKKASPHFVSQGKARVTTVSMHARGSSPLCARPCAFSAADPGNESSSSASTTAVHFGDARISRACTHPVIVSPHVVMPAFIAPQCNAAIVPATAHGSLAAPSAASIAAEVTDGFSSCKASSRARFAPRCAATASPDVS